MRFGSIDTYTSLLTVTMVFMYELFLTVWDLL